MGAQGERVLPGIAPSPAAARLVRIVQASRRALARNPNMMAGLVILAAIVTIVVFAPLIDRVDPLKISGTDRLQAPSARHWFGTDQVGRDIYSRTVHGGRISLIVGSAVALIVATAGAVMGLIAGYYRRADEILMRFMDSIMAFPTLLLALALIALLGGNITNVIIVISVVDTPRMVRLVRASVLSAREMDFVTAARALGAGAPRIMGLHILPNILAPIIIQATFVFASAILVEAALSFLGAGVNPETPTWGNIIGIGRTYIQRAFWVTFFPGLFLSITVLAINLMGDGLRDALDPKLRRRG